MEVAVGHVRHVPCTVPDDPASRMRAIREIVARHCALFMQKGGDVGRSQCASNLGNNITSGTSNGFDADRLQVVAFSGGITNEMYHVYCEGWEAHSVVMRIFGKETERVISRGDELFYQSLFIPTYVRGQNFLVYQYLYQYEPLPFVEMVKEYEKIARGIAFFHVRATLEARSDYSVTPVGGVVGAGGATVGPTNTCSRFDLEENYIVHSLTEWVEQALSETVQEKVDATKRATYASVAQQLKEEAQWLLPLMQRHSPELGESTCHNDLLSGNIMRQKSDGALKIIDFEYAKRNYFLFDIANHFNEYTGLECDYATYFPSEEHMKKFVTTYMCAMREELEKHAEEAKRRQLTDIIPGQQHFFMCDVGGVEGDKRIHRMVQLVKLLTLASHLSWSVWALLQEAVSKTDMDFLRYSQLRLSRYLETRKEFSASS
ncbi:choline/ethanolamine kinase, putative [Trypanosoma brucei brucei TREU927]|uniref:ethanolamine kinase n=2 Tax=Trypanosoma brucei brucei TaxID=5702 RepID=Q386V0_TRYB2|nr:choline/ethanolamine kinase, putative [Trypanosoma brucei brucei TREU927]EAN79181.1 choline/ethanolamine kinase, putative [Trypanosoma brucei brucei TREU927]CAP73998.1 ethanolamine kinase [Trypanosoma brucei brucei]